MRWIPLCLEDTLGIYDVVWRCFAGTVAASEVSRPPVCACMGGGKIFIFFKNFKIDIFDPTVPGIAPNGLKMPGDVHETSRKLSLEYRPYG